MVLSITLSLNRNQDIPAIHDHPKLSTLYMGGKSPEKLAQLVESNFPWNLHYTPNMTCYFIEKDFIASDIWLCNSFMHMTEHVELFPVICFGQM